MINPATVPASGSASPATSQNRKASPETDIAVAAGAVCSADFEVRWEGLPSKKIGCGLSGFSISVSQRIRWKDESRMWPSVVIDCDDAPDGGLLIRIRVADPEWNAALQIAAIGSRPDDVSCLAPIGCNLDHVGSDA